MEENMVKFEEKLKELVALGKKKKNILELQEINDLFADMELQPEQMEKVFEYLDAKNIEFAYEIQQYSNEEKYPDIDAGALEIEMDEENGYYQISFGIEEDYEVYIISIDEWNVEY